ncbi:MAG: SusD/RagB family nutrient-binding outer membrane lipoprotein [Prevotellaceae bacterium]|jgi:hypothetical protein|nr:SusD/RagB family nutrient-binding outer membrane lipoprotein [Prevotellaceae bacterium]
MKKIQALILSACLLFAGCQAELEEKFYDPEKYRAPENMIMPGMFAKVIYEWKIFIQDYGEYWWGLSGTGPAGYAQIGVRPMVYDAIFNNWTQQSNWNDNFQNSVGSYFNHSYERIRPWGLMKLMLETNDGAYSRENLLYFQIVSIVKDYCFMRNVDMFNDIPYSDALRGIDGVLFVKYDDAKEVYHTCLQNIKEFTSGLKASHDAMSDASRAIFKQQDIVFKGDIDKWIGWATAMRLRFAMRVSNVDETTAKEHIADILGGNSLPSRDLTWDAPFTTINATLSGGGETWVRGFIERFTSYFIPDVVMKRMNRGTLAYEPGTDDPRLPVLAMPTKWGDYRGVRMERAAAMRTQAEEKLVYVGEDVKDEKEEDRKQRIEGLRRTYNAAHPDDTMTARQWSLYQNIASSNFTIVNYTNFRNNLDVLLGINAVSSYNMKTLVFNEPPVYMSSLAETDLLLAEIAERNLGSTGKSAAEHLADALKHSVRFWYEYNKRSTYEPDPVEFPKYSKERVKEILSPPEPSAAIVNQYADVLRQTYAAAPDKMEIIMQQKYIHFNMIGIYELWAELRRTRRPKLEPVTTLNDTKSKVQIERTRYPSSEQSVNMENYAKVQAQDNFTSPIFWVKNPSESFYREDLLP